jgi:putative transposase
MIEGDHGQISIRRQCDLLGLSRSSFYYEPGNESELNMILMRLLDEQYTKTPFYGIRRMTAGLNRQGYQVNHKRVQRLMRIMGLYAIYAKPRTTVSNKENKVYPYLLRNFVIGRPNQVWSADITYIRMQHGFMYLTAIIDWFSRYVLTWELSNTLDGLFCLKALEQALRKGKPEIFNTDQGVQFTAAGFAHAVECAGIKFSMDGRGRALDNVFVERLWRSVKYEDIYLKEYDTVSSLLKGLTHYFNFYNNERLHQSLGYRTPAEVHFETKLTGKSLS